MHEFTCGHEECNAVLTSSDKDDLMRQVAEHLKKVHNVKRPTQTLMNYLASTIVTRLSARAVE